jgi:hypothetical protein
MDIWESMYIHTYNKHNMLIPEQHDSDHNSLYDLVQIPRDTNTPNQTVSLHSPDDAHALMG